MSTSNQNPDQPQRALQPATRCHTLRRATPPPTEAQPLVSHILLNGDDAGTFFNLRGRTHQLAGDATDFAGFLADILTAQAWEFCRDETMRSAAMSLQMADDQQNIDATFKEIDDPTRQYIAWKKLSVQQPFRDLCRDADRYFRRIRQAQESIHKAVSRRLR